ncbi:Mak10 subunit, NatC N-terminal acetyltransferase-domain-containing protein [Vararia minispora EC-137]|uniref:Mak10 subunit, NatC N-terminal acetyltransferase-domain-containing protein n=1 Tax=Vararia minispora EC-137 TaxID=1314806 RepID=A0ACB8QTS0_9AGAM|nr:Mak10 subunit, NatC N-terminal acetyltransferase-domain-containing protein [Vararia minispora EC-137]
MSAALPGGNDFVDVTDVFRNAAQDMDPEDVLLVDGFSLYDAMTALQIGDPRMDTGVILEEQRRPPFDPLTPLLPEELCYILDKSLACEMHWHSGHTLSQTVYTFLYVHHYRSLEPDMIQAGMPKILDPNRPFGLVTVVLRGVLTAYLKCCDLVWRELSKGRVYDTEDCQLEKSEVSLAEGVPTGTIVARLQDGIFWLEHCSYDLGIWRTPLLDRLRLRQILLNLFRADPVRSKSELRILVDRARTILDRIRDGVPPPTPRPDSCAAFAFDPYVTRQLSNTMPLQPLALPSQEVAWDTLAAILDGFEELSKLATETHILSWRAIGSLHASSGHLLPAFSTFYNGAYVLGTIPVTSLVDSFFTESLGLRSIPSTWTISRIPDIQQRIIKLLLREVQSGWFNFPRRRRHLTNSLLDWSALYIRLRQFADTTQAHDQNELVYLRNVPRVALMWRLECLREIVFSGFKLELYAPSERPFAYWYLCRILSDHLFILDTIDPMISSGSLARQDLSVSRPFLTALQDMCASMFVMTIPLINVSPERMYLNFLKRYKWAFLPQYARLPEPMPTMPVYDDFVDACEAKLKDHRFSPAQCFEHARDLLSQLTSTAAGSASAWHEERSRFFTSLSSLSAQLASAVPMTVKHVPHFDQKSFNWDATDHRWFPGIQAAPS